MSNAVKDALLDVIESLYQITRRGDLTSMDIAQADEAYGIAQKTVSSSLPSLPEGAVEGRIAKIKAIIDTIPMGGSKEGRPDYVHMISSDKVAELRRLVALSQNGDLPEGAADNEMKVLFDDLADMEELDAELRRLRAAEGRYREALERIKVFLEPNRWDQHNYIIWKIVTEALSHIGEQENQCDHEMVPYNGRWECAFCGDTEYTECPECNGSFSFRKPTDGKCPWCEKPLAGLEADHA